MNTGLALLGLSRVITFEKTLGINMPNLGERLLIKLLPFLCIVFISTFLAVVFPKCLFLGTDEG